MVNLNVFSVKFYYISDKAGTNFILFFWLPPSKLVYLTSQKNKIQHIFVTQWRKNVSELFVLDVGGQFDDFGILRLLNSIKEKILFGYVPEKQHSNDWWIEIFELKSVYKTNTFLNILSFFIQLIFKMSLKILGQFRLASNEYGG